MNKLIKYFLQGLLYTVPISLTIYIIWEILNSADELVSQFLPFKFWGLGIVIILAFITLAGLIGNYLVAFPLAIAFEKYLTKAPLIRLIYSSIKDLISSFVGQKKKFNKPVLVKLYPESEIYRLGFLSDEDLSEFDLSEEFVTVYVPHSYAISGQLFIVKRDAIKLLKNNSTDVMKYIVSGGVIEAE
jgi:uncharacterized membrane protein